jgi:hypothetical protein
MLWWIPTTQNFHLRRLDKTLCTSKGIEQSWGWAWWFMAVIPTTWEAEMRRIEVQSQPGQKVSENPISKNEWGHL